MTDAKAFLKADKTHKGTGIIQGSLKCWETSSLHTCGIIKSLLLNVPHKIPLAEERKLRNPSI